MSDAVDEVTRFVRLDLLCMLCGKPASDGYEYEDPESGVGDRGGPHWVYCRACDCWTEHPDPEREGRRTD